jgi:D-alanine-D-alanine ligase
MGERTAGKRLLAELSEVAKEWEIPFGSETSVWPSVAGLAPDETAVLCGMGPVARDLYTPQEAVQRISMVQHTLLLAEFLQRTES